ncbi:hypothetical protein B9G39_29565 [Zooshikella ganghwensis]|uniref:Uncharacterized protein n=1 Tax=Zooshikella ganghwensis TaxID=202772 RepID=A0A4P9VG00_9GAMM|nr:hypothetical protein B9G39_29565 [Zooshikella ganghwensis]
MSERRSLIVTKMVYIIFSNKRHQYISGIFSSLVQAEEYVSRYDEASKESSNIIPVELVYPFYLTEDEKGLGAALF